MVPARRRRVAARPPARRRRDSCSRRAGAAVVHEDPVCAFDGTACVGTLHVVARGEWLWKIARAELVRQGHSSRNAADVRAYVAKIYATNRPAIGRDPHRLRTGTRLVLPPAR
jgi:nucleoid-associated protein YgaU